MCVGRRLVALEVVEAKLVKNGDRRIFRSSACFVSSAKTPSENRMAVPKFCPDPLLRRAAN